MVTLEAVGELGGHEFLASCLPGSHGPQAARDSGQCPNNELPANKGGGGRGGGVIVL